MKNKRLMASFRIFSSPLLLPPSFGSKLSRSVEVYPLVSSIDSFSFFPRHVPGLLYFALLLVRICELMLILRFRLQPATCEPASEQHIATWQKNDPGFLLLSIAMREKGGKSSWLVMFRRPWHFPSKKKRIIYGALGGGEEEGGERGKRALKGFWIHEASPLSGEDRRMTKRNFFPLFWLTEKLSRVRGKLRHARHEFIDSLSHNGVSTLPMSTFAHRKSVERSMTKEEAKERGLDYCFFLTRSFFFFSHKGIPLSLGIRGIKGWFLTDSADRTLYCTCWLCDEKKRH